MQQNAQTDTRLTSTCFDLDCYEFNAGSKEFPATLALNSRNEPADKSEAIVLPVIPTVCLSLQAPQKRLENWRLVLVRGVSETLTPNHIIGSAVQIPKGRTSPIAAFDPLTRRVRTHSGSVYELGSPEMAFERSAADVMRCLGF